MQQIARDRPFQNKRFGSERYLSGRKLIVPVSRRNRRGVRVVPNHLWFSIVTVSISDTAPIGSLLLLRSQPWLTMRSEVMKVGTEK